MKFKNKIIESLKIKKPVFYISTNNFCYEEGKRLRETWADYIRLDIEHGPFNTTGIQAFMRGSSR